MKKILFLSAVAGLSLMVNVATIKAEVRSCPTHDWNEIEAAIQETGRWEDGNMIVEYVVATDLNS